MTDTQGQASVDDRFTPTQNPQSPGGQSLTPANANLQTTSAAVDVNTPLRISSVGDGAFYPVDLSNTTTTEVATTTRQPTNQHYPIFIGGGLIVLLCVVVTWRMTKKTSDKRLLKRSYGES